MTRDYKELQEDIVFAITKSLSEEWLHVVVNYEMLYHEGTREHDRLGFYIVRTKDCGLAKKQLKFTDEIKRAFIDLNVASANVNQQHWTVCDLVLDRNGEFQMNFSYDKPKRINAILDEESYFRFDKYLESYKP